MASLFQILKKKPTDSTILWFVSVHQLIMVSECQVSLFFVVIRDFPQLFLMIRISSKIIRALNINKAHADDDISIRMIKIGDSALMKPLSIIFNNSLKTGTFPCIWKKSNVMPVHKKMINNSFIIISFITTNIW